MSRVQNVEEASMFYATTEDALDDSGYVLTRSGVTTAGNVKKAGASDAPVGVAYTSTKDPVTETAMANRKVAIQRRGVAKVKLSGTNAAIAAGDLIGPAAGGVCDKLTIDTTSAATLWTGLQLILGVAREAKGANAGGKIEVELAPLLG